MKLMTLFVNALGGSITYTAIALFYKLTLQFGLDPLIGFALFILLLIGVFILGNGLFVIPWKEQTTVTDQIAVSKSGDKYFVKKDNEEVKIAEYEETEKTDNSRYQLKTTKYYGILGTGIEEKNTLIVPVDVNLLQEGK